MVNPYHLDVAGNFLPHSHKGWMAFFQVAVMDAVIKFAVVGPIIAHRAEDLNFVYQGG